MQRAAAGGREVGGTFYSDVGYLDLIPRMELPVGRTITRHRQAKPPPSGSAKCPSNAASPGWAKALLYMDEPDLCGILVRTSTGAGG